MSDENVHLSPSGECQNIMDLGDMHYEGLRGCASLLK